MNGLEDPASKYILSKELELCESCEKWTNVIIQKRRSPCLFRALVPKRALKKIERKTLTGSKK